MADSNRKLTGAFFQSLDGVVQAPGGPDEDTRGGFKYGGWTAPFMDESTSGPMNELFEADYDLLLGKRTYEIFSAFWPHNQDQPIGAKFQRIEKYVLTHDKDLSWANSHALEGDTAEVVRKLKQSKGRDLLIQGSSQLYAPLLAAGLIDRLVVMTFPVMLGEGIRIFDGDTKASGLEMVKHFVSDKGVVFATYEPAGKVQTGTFESQPPSDDELARRKRWAKAPPK